MMIHTKRPLHNHLAAFVNWIAPDPDKEEEIRKQAEEIRERICTKASADGLTIRSTPWSGSFKKRTGLRRHMQGHSDIEGQDVDLPFVISPRTKEQELITSLLDRFLRYADQSYPLTTRKTTKSSIKLEFTGTKLAYDLVPMLAGDQPDTQVIIRKDGERHQTSVQKHIEFMVSRTRKSNEQPGRVKFNECVRLLKWWRDVQTQGESDTYPSMLIDLMCAYAFDQHGVEKTYPDTLAKWFDCLANMVEKRRPIHFSDYTMWGSLPTDPMWAVIDPVSPHNNVAKKLSSAEIEVLGDWLADARDSILAAIVADQDNDETKSLNQLAHVFGNPILSHNANTKDK